MVRSPAPAPEEFGDRDVSVGTSTISMVSVPPATLPQKSVAAVWMLLKTPVWVGVPPIAMLGNGEVMPRGKFAGFVTPPSLKGGVPPEKRLALYNWFKVPLGRMGWIACKGGLIVNVAAFEVRVVSWTTMVTATGLAT